MCISFTLGFDDIVTGPADIRSWMDARVGIE
jgi:hypothetical protein